jgi:hypothetical protein
MGRSWPGSSCSGLVNHPLPSRLSSAPSPTPGKLATAAWRHGAGSWVVATFGMPPIPADAAIARAGQLLQLAHGEPWAEASIPGPLSLIYAYAGRLADARDAIARARSAYDARERNSHGQWTQPWPVRRS